MTPSEATARCWVEIDLDALISNYCEAIRILDGKSQLICVLKANAYGMGAKVVGQTLYKAGARFFAVACVSEAEELRSVLPDARILVMGLSGREEALRAIEKNIELTCYSKESASQLLEAASKAGQKVRAHIKLDTGLHRLGFAPCDDEAMLAFAKDERVRLEGLYTHLALRNRQEDLRQFALFDRADALLKESGVAGYLRHACDSIGMVRYPERHMEAVRAGAWLYGVCPYRCPYPERDKLIARFMARISDIHQVPAGECVGYDEDHPLARSSRVATVSAGYVDGFPRLNSLGRAVVCGKSAAVLGLVCMDQLMLDVTDIPLAAPGDTVTLLGDEIGLNEYAATAAMNRNECLSRMGRRVPKLYLKNGEPALITVDL